jgi:hypothetical protein
VVREAIDGETRVDRNEASHAAVVIGAEKNDGVNP